MEQGFIRLAKFYSVAMSLCILLILVSCKSESNQEKEVSKYNEVTFIDPLNIGEDSVRSLIGNKVPYHTWEKWGYPKTLEGTDNEHWVVFLEKANISFISIKSTDKVIFAGFGEQSAINFKKQL
ncbi:MAG: hypothetical protein AAFX87_14890 [Bacteroidota bacterium]